jgi:Ca2+-binding EF-hand superfamily protein
MNIDDNLQGVICSPILAFYNIASIIENKLKISTLEFVYKNGLSLEDEININDFYTKIADNLKIDDITTIIVFKGLDPDKKGKILVQDFVVVIDSYREDSSKTQESKESLTENVKLINDLKYVKSQLEEEAVSVDDIFNKTNLQDPAKLFEIYNNIKLLIKGINPDILENVLNFLKREDSKIYKKDLEHFINHPSIDQNFIQNFLRSKNKSSTQNKFLLNDMQIFWINKLCNHLDSISITPLMAFQTAAEKSAKEMNLDFFKRKLQKMIPQSRVNATELICFSDSLDINKTKIISLEDFLELIEIAKNDPKFKVSFAVGSSTNLTSGNNLINSFIKPKRNASELPVKGNTKALSVLKTDLSKTHVQSPPQLSSKGKMTVENNFLKEKNDENKILSKTQQVPLKQSLDTSILNKPTERDLVQDFIKDLSVFENGEWSLIELMEDLPFSEHGLITTFDILTLLSKKFSPTINKSKLCSLAKKIDQNEDGFISINDCIIFLLSYIKHRSTKLALKEISRKIEHEEKITTEDYFSRKHLQASNEIYFVNFVQFFIKNFELEPPVVKKVYEELKKMLNKNSILISDLIDLINEYREDSRKSREKKSNKDYNSISLLDKKFYEEEMKSFIRILQKAFGVKFESFIKDMDSFLSIPNIMKLSQFRESFVKPLHMDYSLGIATFQLLRSLSGKETAQINKDDLFNLIESYFNTGVVETDPEVILFFVENNYTPIKYCFEAIPYNFSGVPVIDLLRLFEIFYPKINKRILMTLARSVDYYKTGILTFKNFSDFIFNNSKKDQFSNDLMIKYLSSIVDFSNSDTKEFIFIQANLKKGDTIIHLNEHNHLFNLKLKFDFEQSENLFLFLISNSKNINGYFIDRLVRLVNLHRQNKKEVSKSSVYDNTSQVVAVKAQSKEFTEFLRLLNENVPLVETFNNLNVSEQLHIPILEILNIILNFYKNIIDLDKRFLIKFLKTLDKDKKGSVHYESFIKTMKNLLEEFEVSIPLHCKYLSHKIHKEHEGKWKEYLNYKGLAANKYITKDQFEKVFRDECLNDDGISHNLFEFLKEKKGANSNLLFIQNYVDYLTGLNNSQLNNLSKGKKLSEEEAEDYLKTTIIRLERDDSVKLSDIFEKIEIKYANSYGKINSDFIKQILRDIYNLDNFTIDVFVSYFCKLLSLFDLIKLVEFIQLNSEKSKISIVSILQKIKKKIPKDKSSINFFKMININPHRPLSLNETCQLLSPIFDLSTYESILLFKQIVSEESNSLKDDYKINMDFLLQYFSLYKLFLKEERAVQNKKLDPKIMNALIKLVSYLDSQPNKMQIFKKFDKDGNGILNRIEFLDMLKSCKEAGLNDSQMILILNFADKNGDDCINFIEFIEFINSIQNGQEINENRIVTEYQEEEIKLKDNPKINEKLKSPEKSPNSIQTKVDQLKLKENYEFNMSNINIEKETPLNIVLFSIQEDLYMKLGKKDSLENQFIILDKNNSETISKDNFFSILQKIESIKDSFDEELEERVWNYSMEGCSKKIQNLLLLENLVHYRNFLNNILNFKVKAKIILNASVKNDKQSNTTNSFIKSIGKSTKEESKKSLYDKNSTSKNTVLNFLKMKSNDQNEITNNLKAKSFSKNSKVISVLSENLGINYAFEKIEQIEALQSKMMQSFTFNKDSHSNITKEQEKKLKINFSNFINKVALTEYKGYEYEINPDQDYFRRPNGTVCETILNNEDAALKKCEEIFNSLKEGEVFFDKDFGSQPNDKDLKHRLSIYSKGEPPKGYIEPNLIEWYRMDEICDDDPVFIDNGAEANDVCQGAIGDCWFISALSVIATKDHLLRGEFNPDILDDGIITEEESLMLSTGVYPPIFQIFRNKNIFCFRFYKNFEWKYVIIDDRLPCRKVFEKSQPKKLIYGKCKSDREFWVPLIEKAFAKLHGSYEALISGFIDDGLVDLTGLVARKMVLDKESYLNENNKEEFWNLLKNYSQVSYDNIKDKKERDLKALILTRNNTMMGCSIDAKVVESEVVYNNHKSGILAGHAYSILDTIEISKPMSLKKRKSSRLLRIRNPWGYKEWNGKWSDESPEVEKNKQL